MKQDRYTAFLVRLLLRVKNFQSDAPYLQYFSTGEICLSGSILLRGAERREIKYPHLFPEASVLLNLLPTLGFNIRSSQISSVPGRTDQITYHDKKVALVNYHE